MEAMFAQHNPLVFGQSVGHQIYNPQRRLRRPCSLHLTHSISLSVRENLPRVSESHHERSSSNCVTEGPGENARRHVSSPNSELHAQSRKLFLSEPELNKDEEDDLDGGDLHKYCEDSFFQLCGDLRETKHSTMGDTAGSWPNLTILHQGMDHGEIQKGYQHRRVSRETPVLMDCEEKDWADDNYYKSTVSSEQLGGYGCVHDKAFSDCGSSGQEQNDYISDSSCNSSDGVLVNFSAIYNRTNNAVPATPYDLESPVMKSTSQDDNSIPYGSPCTVDPNCNVYRGDSNSLSSLEISDLTDCLENQGRLLASTNSYYKLVSCDLSSQSPTSSVWSTVTSCSDVHSQRSSTPPIEYFLFRKPEGEEQDQPNLQAVRNTELQRNKRNIRKVSKEATERKVYIQMHQTGCRDSELNSYEDNQENTTKKSLPHVQRCSSQPTISSDEPETPKTSFAELARHKKSDGDLTALKNSRKASTRFQLNQNQEKGLSQKRQNGTLLKQNGPGLESPQSSGSCGCPSAGASASSPEVMHYSKAQRPTSLPIQPFVLEPPSGKQPSKVLGSLLDQYVSHKHEKPSMSKCKGLTRHLRPSPLGSCSFMHLEVASSTDSCSSSTPTPVQPHIRLHWTPPSRALFQPQTDQSPSSEHELPKKNPNADQTNQQVMACPEQGFGKQSISDEIMSEPFFSKQMSQQKTAVLDPAITSVTGAGRCDRCVSDAQALQTSAVSRNLPCVLQKESHQHGDSSSLTDGPPEEFCLSPHACTEFLSIDLLHKKDMLKRVSLAVELITAHFKSCTEPHEKIKLGSSSQCLGITKLVLDRLCPAIRKLFQDGLRSFKLDLIVGQRRIKAWSVVEAFTQPGPSNHMLHSLVSVVRKCPKLTNHNMRLNAFFMGLLNLSALESWFCHLHTCVDVITEYYHPWAFLALSHEFAFKSLYQELLHLLHPLSQLPFNLHLLSESKLQMRLNQTQAESSLSVCTFPWRPKSQKIDGCTERQENGFSKQSKISEDKQRSVSVGSSEKKCAGWWLSQASTTEGLHPVSIPDMRNEILMDNHERTSRLSVRSEEDKPPTEWCWARLFGSGIGERRGNINQSHRAKPPSQWIKLGASKVDLLTQLVWGRDTTRALCQ